MTTATPPSLSDHVRKCVDHFLKKQEDDEHADLYRIILEAVEAPILESVLTHTQGNTSKAARIMGIGRSTLIKKIKLYKDKGYLNDITS